MNKFTNRNVLITGATSGLGRELSIYFNQKVEKLVCVGKSYSKIRSLKKKLKNKKNSYFNGDLSDQKKLKNF